ncbi:MAG TPA: GMC family oxidoreductase [Opitutaceae bacterium]|jgi:choline dehydrogenase-like flavoprotein
MSEQNYDAIVVGSGISGGWAAKELTEKGLKVLLLERGENIEHVSGYKNALKAPWEIPHRDHLTQKMREEHPVLIRDYFMHEANVDYWVKDAESPYVEVRPFNWFRGYHVGGRSLMWGRQSYRWNRFDYEANAKEGIAIDWPVRYEDMAPWYDHVETFAGISGSLEGLESLPDGKYTPPMDMTVVEKHVAARIKDHYKGSRHMIIGRSANTTEPRPGRSSCQFRNKCDLGCPFGAYFSTQSSTLPAAVATGNLTLRPWSIVTQVTYDKDRKRATGVEVMDGQTMETTRYTSKIVFLCASTLNTAWVLMNSATDIWPDGLGSSSGELGHNVMDHHFRVGASGEVEGFEDRYVYGRRPNGIYIPRYRNLFGDKRDYLRGFGYQGSGDRKGWNREIAEYGVGAQMKAALLEPGHWQMGIGAFGETLPNHNNKVTLDKNKKDKWGLPVLAMDADIGENEHKMRKDMADDAAEMLEAAGVKNVKKHEDTYAMGQGIHEMGTARMGLDPKTSVLNKHNQVWDAPNVYVTDGACMVSTSCVNPSLTYMAMTARASHHAVESLKRMDI